MEQIAKEKYCTPSQLARASLFAQSDEFIPIVGTKRRKYLEENAGALRVKLSPQDLRRIEKHCSVGRSWLLNQIGFGSGRCLSVAKRNERA